MVCLIFHTTIIINRKNWRITIKLHFESLSTFCFKANVHTCYDPLPLFVFVRFSNPRPQPPLPSRTTLLNERTFLMTPKNFNCEMKFYISKKFWPFYYFKHSNFMQFEFENHWVKSFRKEQHGFYKHQKKKAGKLSKRCLTSDERNKILDVFKKKKNCWEIAEQFKIGKTQANQYSQKRSMLKSRIRELSSKRLQTPLKRNVRFDCTIGLKNAKLLESIYADHCWKSKRWILKIFWTHQI